MPIPARVQAHPGCSGRVGAVSRKTYSELTWAVLGRCYGKCLGHSAGIRVLRALDLRATQDNLRRLPESRHGEYQER